MAADSDLGARLGALERRLGAVEDVEAIRRLKARYGELVDDRYLRGTARPAEELAPRAREIARLFTEDALWDGGRVLGSCRGRAEIEARMAEPTLRFSRHYFVKPHIEVDGPRGRGRWDLLAPCTTRDGRPHWMAGVEDDEYEKVDGVWLHAAMKLRVVFLAPHETGWGSPAS
ncbi:MAG: nuclear transport factor 2 family protein [Myxococcota bacterium]